MIPSRINKNNAPNNLEDAVDFTTAVLDTLFYTGT